MSTDPNIPDTPSTLTVTHYQQLADQFAQMLGAAAATLPPLEEKHPSTTTFVHGHLNVPIEFVQSAVAATEETPALQGVNGLDPVVSRTDLQFAEAFRPVIDKLTALRDALEYTVQTKLANLSNFALQTYSVAKGIARTRNNAAVIPHIANMKRDLGKRGRPKVQPQPQPEPSPTV